MHKSWVQAIAASSALRVLFIQDEYRQVYAIHNAMERLRVDIVFTCIPENVVEKLYPTESLPGLLKVHTMLGFVPAYLEGRQPAFFEQKRTIDVGYRARGIGFWWLGDLFQEKAEIGARFLQYAGAAGLVCDISSRENDRLHGADWIRFLENCRCTLGTETGASVIDFTGEIEKRVREYCDNNPHATYAEARKRFFQDVDGTIPIGQVSPRHFEAIGCGCCQVLFEGNYSGILHAGKHYVELKKDFSNIGMVLEQIKDNDVVQSIVRTAYKDIIESGRYSYKGFVQSFDVVIADALRTGHRSRFPIANPMDSYGSSSEGVTTRRSVGQALRIVGKRPKEGKLADAVVLRLRSFLLFAWSTLIRLADFHPFFMREWIRLIARAVGHSSWNRPTNPHARCGHNEG